MENNIQNLASLNTTQPQLTFNNKACYSNPSIEVYTEPTLTFDKLDSKKILVSSQYRVFNNE